MGICGAKTTSTSKTRSQDYIEEAKQPNPESLVPDNLPKSTLNAQTKLCSAVKESNIELVEELNIFDDTTRKRPLCGSLTLDSLNACELTFHHSPSLKTYNLDKKSFTKSESLDVPEAMNLTAQVLVDTSGKVHITFSTPSKPLRPGLQPPSQTSTTTLSSVIAKTTYFPSSLAFNNKGVKVSNGTLYLINNISQLVEIDISVGDQCAESRPKVLSLAVVDFCLKMSLNGGRGGRERDYLKTGEKGLRAGAVVTLSEGGVVEEVKSGRKVTVGEGTGYRFSTIQAGEDMIICAGYHRQKRINKLWLLDVNLEVKDCVELENQSKMM